MIAETARSKPMSKIETVTLDLDQRQAPPTGRPVGGGIWRNIGHAKESRRYCWRYYPKARLKQEPMGGFASQA